jgi:hypothetical protein
VFKDHPDGVVSIKYKTEEGAAACLDKMNGRCVGRLQVLLGVLDVSLPSFVDMLLQYLSEFELLQERF